MANEAAKNEREMLIEQLNILIARMRMRGMKVSVSPIYGAVDTTWSILLNGGIQYDTKRHAFFWKEPEPIDLSQFTLDV